MTFLAVLLTLGSISSSSNTPPPADSSAQTEAAAVSGVNPGPQTTVAGPQQTVVSKARPSIPSPSGHLDTFLSGLGLELSVNNDLPKGEVSYSKRFRPKQRADGYPSYFGQTSLSAAISAPLSGTDDLTDPQILDKLSNGPKLTIGVSRYRNWAQATEDGLDVVTVGGWQYGAEASVGYKRFEFSEPISLAGKRVGRVPFSLGGFIAYYPTNERTMYGIGLESQSAFASRDEEVICKPVITVVSNDCLKAPPGGPVKDRGILATAEHRRALGIDWKFADIAIAPKAVIDILTGDVGIELPVYLLVSGDSPILPGIKVGYSSEKDTVIFGVFLKAGFSLTR